MRHRLFIPAATALLFALAACTQDELAGDNRLPEGEGVTQEDIKAKYEDGILRLSVPKKEAKAVENKKYIAIEG